MKKLFISLCLTTAALVVFLSSCKEEDCDTVISGLVIDSVTQQPISNLFLQFYGNSVEFHGPAVLGSVFTDSVGRFHTVLTTGDNEKILLHVNYEMWPKYFEEQAIPIKVCRFNENIIIKLNPQ
jgi:hypothetical protein